MQVRRLGYELGLIYGEDHSRPVLSYGNRSVIFLLNISNYWDGTITRNKESPLNEEVYCFTWGVTSLFHYSEFKERVRQIFPKAPIKGRIYPVFELPEQLCDELVEKHYLLLNGDLTKSDSYHFVYWIIDKGHGVFNLCVNTWFDHLLFLPVRITVKESGNLLRW